MDENNQVFTADDYLNNLQALKDNTVSRDDYQRLVEDNKKLAKALANGEFTSAEEAKSKPVLTSEEARAKLFNGKKKPDLQLFSEVLDLRSAVLAEGGRDPFIFSDPEYIPTEQDKLDAERISKSIEEALEYADGDPTIFRTEMMRRGAKPSKG